MAFEHWFIPPKNWQFTPKIFDPPPWENLPNFGVLFILKAPLTSCGGTLKVWVLISIFSKTSTHGMMKNTPGPRVPPVRSNPRRNMTALSYSWRRRTVFQEYLIGVYTWTTLTTKKRDRGMVTSTSRMENIVRSKEHIPGPSSQAEMMDN